MKKELGIFILLIVLCIITAIINPLFLSAENLQNMARLIGAYGIFSIGLGIVIITSGIDLSVGSVMAVLGVLFSMMLTEWHWMGALAVVAIIALTMGLGLINGLLITKVRIQPFIVTLCGLLFYRGLARFIAGDETKGFGNAQGFESLQAGGDRQRFRSSDAVYFAYNNQRDYVGCAAPFGLRALSLRRRAQ